MREPSVALITAYAGLDTDLSRHNSELLLCDLFCIARPALASAHYGHQGRWRQLIREADTEDPDSVPAHTDARQEDAG